MLVLLELGSVHEMKLVIALILFYNLVLVHVETDWEMSLQREIWVLDIVTVNFLIFVKEVWIFELLNGFMNDL